TPDVVSPTNDSISDLTGQQNFSGIEETLNATNNSNSSPSALQNPTDDLQTNSSLLDTSTPRKQKSTSFPPLQNDTIELFLEVLFANETKIEERCWNIGFMIENLLLLQNVSSQHRNLTPDSPLALFHMARHFPKRVKHFEYYENFDPRMFINTMITQTQSGLKYKKLFTFIAYGLNALYETATLFINASKNRNGSAAAVEWNNNLLALFRG
ncbi:unnamed protein product, partial [Rodentolepis nana]|uniref:CCR4-NOT transcription complex subunit 1 n=1 Tax=Rodentolepis nana TaxID=102285 RepID=A0A0R3TDB6_RODNA